jgi:hypothetical protein
MPSMSLTFPKLRGRGLEALSGGEVGGEMETEAGNGGLVRGREGGVIGAEGGWYAL